MDERERLQERYDDAAFALMMDECAENDGEAFLAEFRAAAGAGELPQISEDMDRCFRDTIKREYAGRERKIRFKQFKRAAARVAVAVFAVIGILSTVVMSVEAWRVPLFSFLHREHDEFTSIRFTEPMEPSGVPSLMNASAALFEGMLPDGYTKVSETITEKVCLVAYQNDDGKIAQIGITPSGGEVRLDTEDAIVTEIFLADYKAVLMEEEGYCVFWHCEKADVLYTIQADALTKEEILEISREIALLGAY